MALPNAFLILCSCSDLPAPSTSETVNPSVDVTLKKWEDCGASIDKAEEISGIKFGESLKNIVSVRAIPYTAIEVVCSLDKSASDNTVTLRKAVSYAVKNSENLSGVNTNGLSPTMATFEIKGANFVNEKGKTVVGAIKPGTASTWLKRLVKHGMIESVDGKGTYRKPLPNGV